MTRPEDLDALARRVQQGDRQAFTELFQATHRELRIFLSSHASSIDMVDEVMQAAYVSCFRTIDRYEPRGTFLSWLKGIGRNLLLKELHEQARACSIEGRVLEELSAKSGLGSLDDDPEVPSHRKLEECIHQLREHSQELIRRRYVDKASIVEMARSLQRSESWVAVTLFRIREVLRTCLSGGEPAYDR